MIDAISAPRGLSAAVSVPAHRPEITAAARAFESVFLSEMLAHAGLGDAGEGLGAGPGEARMGPFLVKAYADRLVESGGVGLAERIAKSLSERAPQ